jgi:nitrite reductase (NAD(P)H)
MTDLEDFGNVKLIDRNKWVLARQLDADAGSLVTRKIQELGLDVLHQKRVAAVNTDEDNNVIGMTFEDGEQIDCCCICFAVSFYMKLVLLGAMINCSLYRLV